MPKSFLTVLVLFCSIPVFAQKKRAFELSLLGRFDRHADYITNLGGRARQDTMQIYGASFGIDLQFHQSITRNLMFYIGAGYYSLGVDKINTTQHPFRGISHYRPINYNDGSTSFLYGTNKYYYNNISYTLGAEWKFAVKAYPSFLKLEFVDYNTFSQHYKIPANKIYYATRKTGQLGWGVNTSVGFQKHFAGFYIKPSLLLPVYQRLQGDDAFKESSNMYLSKWFNGAGLSIKIGKYL